MLRRIGNVQAQKIVVYIQQTPGSLIAQYQMSVICQISQVVMFRYQSKIAGG